MECEAACLYGTVFFVAVWILYELVKKYYCSSKMRELSATSSQVPIVKDV